MKVNGQDYIPTPVDGTGTSNKIEFDARGGVTVSVRPTQETIMQASGRLVYALLSIEVALESVYGRLLNMDPEQEGVPVCIDPETIEGMLERANDYADRLSCRIHKISERLGGEPKEG